MIAAIYIAAVVTFSGVQLHQHRGNYYNDGSAPQISLWDSQIFLAVALGTIAVILIGSSYKTMALAAGGSAVSEMMGARLVSANSTDPDERKLRKWPSRPACPCRRSMSWTTRTASTPSPPATNPATRPSPSRAAA
jgi:hypothetical protein